MRGVFAKRYAQALFSLGVDDNQAQEYGQEIRDFWASLQGAGADGALLYSPAYPKEARGQALNAVLAKAGLSPLVSDFLRLLHLRGRLGSLGEIGVAYARLLDDAAGLTRGILTVPGPLAESQIEALKSALGTLVGRKVEFKVEEDPAIIGGVVAKLGDLVVDGSLRSRLDRLSALLGTV
ncbi:MAG: ATP synthase F1 subunit delta [Deltaproteobacteria bacterium]|jgi:F-type H+-transporting ATPase subunit delta|nr:ATP synthase F1 subunit delta [Deltaproteobacteria bacterium]